MSDVKQIEVKRVDSKFANRFVKLYHYSGKVVSNSQLHFGAFLKGRCSGVMSLGPSMDKSKLMSLVKNTTSNGFIELNRMAFSDVLPRNSESRCIAVMCKLLKKHTPHIRWIVSFADGSQCGDGTIYRASGFHLTSIRENNNTARMSNGEVMHKMTFQAHPAVKQSCIGNRSWFDVMGTSYNWKEFCNKVGATVIKGFQLRYIKLLTAKPSDINYNILPYTKIDEVGAGMYKGVPKVEEID